MADYILLILGIILMILGIIGCLVPVLPGPPFSFLGLIFLHLTRFGHFTNPVLIILGAVAVIVTVELKNLVVPSTEPEVLQSD
jgi:uncharacterized protein YqgC (DUF456 family)